MIGRPATRPAKGHQHAQLSHSYSPRVAHEQSLASDLPCHPGGRIEVIEPAGGAVFRLGILAEDAALAISSLDGRKR